ncbi:UNVERIFIED_CONTAM: Retrovirus-related Pol polyprotein from transposon RE1 [Sesamum latifolium]|uniref:Retrovirus-related Pol polyprotein from transposon RE1 n=1 Tax=Sesamum latifolium TaxID=2727402 RepID=A0AAW2V0Y9_9LAMI
MVNCMPVSTPVECGVKLSSRQEGKKINSTYFKSLWKFEILDLYKTGYSFGVGLVSRHMEAPTTSHLKVAKRILRYIQGTIDHGIFYKSSQDFELVGYCDSDWAGDIDSRKSTTGFVYFMGSSAFTWNSKKQPIVTLSTCEAESKHIDRKYHFIRDCISKKEVKLEYVKSQDQIADIFTKALKFDSFKKLRFSLGVMNLV